MIRKSQSPPPPPFTQRCSIVRQVIIAMIGVVTLSFFPSHGQEGETVHDRNEKYYSHKWCKKAGGDDSITLPDGTKPDCVLHDKVVEFDFGRHMVPYQCVGQAFHYGRMMDKEPECILIQRSDISDKTFRSAVHKAQGGVDYGMSLRCMNHDGEIFDCPSR